MFKTKNEGTLDRIIRIILGAAFVAGGYLYLADWQSIVAYVVGAFTFMTGVTGFCTLYKLLGISTKECKCGEPSCAACPTTPPQTPESPM